MLFYYAILKSQKYRFSGYTVKFFNFLSFPMECCFIALIPSFLFLVSWSHKLEYIKLKKWLKDRGFEDSNLRPAEFWGNVSIIYWWYKFLILLKMLDSCFWFESRTWLASGKNPVTVSLLRTYRKCT